MQRTRTAFLTILVVLGVGLLVLAWFSVSRARHAAQLHDAALNELRSGNYAEARGFFEDALSLRPDEPVYLANYGLCLELLDQPIEAMDAYGHSLELVDDPEVLFRLGRSTCRAGDAEHGVQLMWEANSRYLIRARDAGDLGLCLLDSGRSEQSIPYLERGLEADPGHPEWTQALVRARGYAVVPTIQEGANSP